MAIVNIFKKIHRKINKLFQKKIENCQTPSVFLEKPDSNIPKIKQLKK